MTTPSTFSTQILGQTEKALNAILHRQLAGTGLTEPQWVTLNVALAGSGTLDRGQLISRVSGVLKVAEPEAQAQITELATAHLVHVPDAEGAPVTLTDDGQRLHQEIRAAVTEITERLWGDLPGEQLATAGRVLGTVLARANAELAAA